MSLNVFGADGGLTPFVEPDAPEAGDRFYAREHVGATLILDVFGPEEHDGPYGRSTVIVADVTVVGDKGAGQAFPKAWLNAKAIVDQLTPLAGKTGYVAVIETYQNKKDQTGYRLAAPTAVQTAAAEATYRALAAK